MDAIISASMRVVNYGKDYGTLHLFLSEPRDGFREMEVSASVEGKNAAEVIREMWDLLPEAGLELTRYDRINIAVAVVLATDEYDGSLYFKGSLLSDMVDRMTTNVTAGMFKSIPGLEA